MDPIASSLKAAFSGYKHGNKGFAGASGNGDGKKASVSGLEAGIAAAAKKSLLVQVNFDAPIRVLGGKAAAAAASAASSSSSTFLLLNPLRGVSPRPKSNGHNGGHNGQNGHHGQKKNGQPEEKGKKAFAAAGSNGAAAANPTAPPKPKHVFYPLSSVTVGYDKKRVPGAGMYNVGNTCYLNSTLQALFHTPALFNYLTSGQHQRQCNKTGGGNSFYGGGGGGPPCMICALTYTLRDTLTNNGGAIRPNRVYEKLKVICKHMVQGRQEDAHEFLRYLIESLQRGFLNSSGCPVPQKSLDAASKETTPFNQMFGGYLRQDVTCLRCKYVSVTFQHFMDLLLDIRQASTVEEALQFFFRVERLGSADGGNNMYKCDRCKVKVPAKKKCFIERPPAVLCIQLKRFSLFGGKITKPVQLSRNMDIVQFVKNNSANKAPLQYKLVSMITHVGPSPNCGHYTAIGEAGNGSFFQFDDSSVRPISTHQALNTASYVVFYEMTRSTKATWLNGGAAVEGPVSDAPMIGPTKSPLPATVTSGKNATSNGVHRPKLISANGSINGTNGASNANRIGVVSKLNGQTNPSPKEKPTALVPYGDESSSDEEQEKEKETKPKGSVPVTPPSTPSPRPIPGANFLPRAVAMKTLKTDAPSPRPDTPVVSESRTNGSGTWKVTDSDAHNPSEHSNNSTGSTSSWNVTVAPNGNGSRPGSALDTAIATPPPPQQQSLLQQKRGSLKRSNSVEEYEADLDRGRTKKVKQGYTPDHSGAGSGNNLFQQRQTQQYNNGGGGGNKWSWNNGHGGRHRDHSYSNSSGNRYSSPGGGFSNGGLHRSKSSGNLSNGGSGDHQFKDRNRRRDDRRFSNNSFRRDSRGYGHYNGNRERR